MSPQPVSPPEELEVHPPSQFLEALSSDDEGDENVQSTYGDKGCPPFARTHSSYPGSPGSRGYY